MVDAETVARTLARDPWFTRQDRALQASLLAAGRVRSIAAEQWIYGAGDEDTGPSAAIGGSIRLEVAVGDRRAVLVNILGAGTVIGQSRRFGGGPRIVTARAATESEVWLVSDVALQQISTRQPEIWRAVSELLYRQLANALQRTGETLALPPRELILSRLRSLAPGEAGSWTEVRATQSDIAEMTGMSRKTASAHLIALQAAGQVRLGYGRMLVRC